MEQANVTRSPLYLESTVEAAGFYKRLGFSQGEEISLPIRVDGGSETVLYREVAFTYFYE
jgi:hypothetical protein